MKKFIIGTFMAILLISNQVNAQWEELDSGYESPWIFFANSFPEGQNSIGYAAAMYTTNNGDGLIVKTEDGGETWSTLYPTSGDIDGLQAIYFTSTDVGYAGGWNNYFIHTEDGGETWSDMDVGTGIWYFVDIEFWDENNGVAAASMDNGGQPIFVTDDAGETWTQASSGIDQGILDVTYADENTLFAVGTAGKISKSTDGGLTWSTIYTTTGILFGVDFEGTSFGVVGGEDGKMLATTDGGQNWSTYSTGYENLWAAKAFSGDSAYLGGTDNNIYKTADGGDTWEIDNNGSEGSLYAFTMASNGVVFASGAAGSILRKQGPLNAGFNADQTTICAGDTVNFTDNSVAATSWSWTFEGGDPGTSTDQNPSVIYDTPGEYDVELEVSDGTNTDSEIQYGYITVLDTPEQADQPDGDAEVCTDNYYSYNTNEVSQATSYEWELSPEDAGTLTGTTSTAQLETAIDWEGDFTIRVRALNDCGEGEWSDFFEGTLMYSPETFDIEGGGTYCNNDEGLEITLNGSQEDVDYELYFEGEPTGNIVEGTGDEISFGLQTEEGYYSAVGSSESCEIDMNNQAEIIIEYAPVEPGMPTGDNLICGEETSDYETSGSDGAEDYVWFLDPEEAGTIVGDGLNATVSWDQGFLGLAYVSVSGTNECGEGNPSSEIEVSVGQAPEPVISGPEMVCDNTSEEYEVEGQSGSSFEWEVTGGTISAGQGTNSITVDWAEPGTGNLIVTETSEQLCTGTSEEYAVTIDDCTDISEYLQNGTLVISPNPAENILNVSYITRTAAANKAVLMNMMGQIILESEGQDRAGNQNHQFNISELSKGIYFIRIESKKGTVTTKRFIKK